MNPKTMKIGAASMGSLTVIATALSLGPTSSTDSDASRAVRPASRSAATASHDDTASSVRDAFEMFWLRAHGHGLRSAWVTMRSPNTSSEAATSSPNGDGDSASDSDSDSDSADSITVTVPHRVTVIMPRYEGGSDPSVTPPTYEGGTDPSVAQDGRKIVIDPGESGTWTNPEVDPGKPGSVDSPRVIVE